MKLLFSILVIFFSLHIHAQENRIILAPVSHLYVPLGFDDNDNVEIVVTGNFPNPCYTRNRVDIFIKDHKIEVTIKALYRNGKNRITCPQMLVPYKEVISLGNLPRGPYSLSVNYILKDQLEIKEARSNVIDEHFYAFVDYVARDEVTQELKLFAYRTSECMVLDRVEYLNEKDTISILPIMKQVSEFCPMKLTPYQIKIAPPFENVKTNKVLLHVRTIDGKSVNTIIDKRI
jgi:hypothetical protein